MKYIGQIALQFLLLGGCGIASLVIADLAEAQISPDSTLLSPSRVSPSGNVVVITGGTQAGPNLFHSFREFSIPEGSSASFREINSNINNIITRVTGSSASNINGVIETLRADGSISSANFFLINPNGIVFGPNAALNVGGSFLATTASRIDFADGTQFKANSTQASPLLTVSVPIGLQFGRNPGTILNQARSNLVLDDFGNPIAGGLQVPVGRTLALLGGDVITSGGVLIVESGRIELGSVGNSEFVDLTSTNRGWVLGYEGVQNFQDIKFLQEATIDSSGASGGDIHLQGRRINLVGQSFITSTTLGAQDGRNISIQAEQLNLRDFSLISTSTGGSGASGSIDINTNQLSIRDAEISANTNAMGEGGNLTITASDSIDLIGSRFVIDGEPFPSGLFTQSLEAASGNGGAILIRTPYLHIRDGAQVSTITFGRGNSGTIQVQATTVELIGTALTDRNQVVLSEDNLPFPSGLLTGAEGDTSSGNGGTLIVNTEQLSLRDGAILKATTEGSGNAGRLIVRASEMVEVTGTAPDGRFPTSIIAASGGIPGLEGGGVVSATGQGGELSLQTRTLRVEDGAAIAVGSINPTGNSMGAGSLQISARTTYLNEGRLISETASGDGGNIDLQAQDILLLQNNSEISTTAGVIGAGGDGGNIVIDTDYIASAPLANSDIRANAFTGGGGNVSITAQGIFGIESRTENTSLSDITASSEFGINGSISINTPDTDPERGLIELPADVVDTADQVNQVCPTRTTATRARSSFVVTGRGGLPLNPNDPLNGNDLQTGWAALNPEATPTVETSSPEIPSESQLVEAQTWVKGNYGEVIFLAQSTQSPQSTSRSTPSTPVPCQ